MTTNHSCDQLLGGEGHGQDIVDTVVKGDQFRLQVAPPRQGDHRDAVGGGGGIAEPVEDRAVGKVHVDDRKMRAPRRERGQGFFGILRHLRVGDAVVERECDVLGKHRLIDH